MHGIEQGRRPGGETMASDRGTKTSPSLADVELMGGFCLRVGRDLIDLPESSQRLVAFLALAGAAKERSLVASALWPEKSEGRATANLRSSLWRLPRIEGEDAVVAHRSRLRLHPAIAVDAWTLEDTGWQLVAADRSEAGSEHLRRLDRRLFLADLLPGWYEDWVIAERERLAQLQLHFLEALTYSLVETGQLAEALDVAIRLVAADSLREGSQRALLRVYCEEGSLGQARRQFANYQDELAREFGCEPDISLDAILADVESRRRHPSDPAPRRTITARPPTPRRPSRAAGFRRSLRS